ncbi:MAG TPA: hypothetical protein VMY35_02680, partial [Phycisphaerae bacterium]|nr:hypothetical protein [Phycisphaerae bacterium]
MSDERQLAEGWREAWIQVGDKDNEGHAVFRSLPVLYRDIGHGDCRKRHWHPANDAPDECFANPARDGPLKAGERVYVDCPVGACRWETLDRHVGFGRIGVTEIGRGRDCVQVEMESPCAPLILPLAACHREGPQGEPPEEGAVFLGLFEVPYGMGDFWWRADGRLQAGRVDDSPYAEIEWPTWTPEELSAPDIERYLRPVWTTAH